MLEGLWGFESGGGEPEGQAAHLPPRHRPVVCSVASMSPREATSVSHLLSLSLGALSLPPGLSLSVSLSEASDSC